MASERNDGGLMISMSMRQLYKSVAMQGLLCGAKPEHGSLEAFGRAAGQIADALLAEDAAWAKGQKEKSDGNTGS